MSYEIHSTGTCFDDAIDFMQGFLAKARYERREDEFANFCDHVRLVHGICVHETGEPYAHAWVVYADKVIQAGFVNSERILYEMPTSEFKELFKPIVSTRYSYT